MKIALIYLGRRGAGGPISLALGSELAKQAEVRAFLSTRLENLPAWRSAGFPHQAVETFSNPLGLVWSLATRRQINRLAEHIRAFAPDVLLFPMVHPWNASLQARLSNIPAVVMVHDPRPHPGLVGKVIRQLEDPSLQRAARCMVFSHNLIADLYMRGVPAGRIAVAPLGLMDYTEGKLLPSPRPPTILFFGRITEYKGIEVLLPAFEQAQKRFPQAKLIIAGEGHMQPYESALRRLTGVELINRWIDESEIHGIFARAGIVALPYTSASQSGVLPIAASFALPVIATATGGLVEQVTHEKTGLLIPPGDAPALAAALERLLAQQAYAEQLGFALRAEYLATRTWQQAAAAVLSTCQAALNYN